MEMTINIPTLVVQIANFLILLVVLKMVLYEPMVAAIQEREGRIKRALDDAESINAEALSLKEQYETKLRAAQSEAARVVQNATQEGERLKSELVTEGHGEKQRIIDKGHQEVAYERQQATAEIRGRVVNLSVDMAGQLLRDTLGPSEHRAIVEQFVKKAENIHVG